MAFFSNYYTKEEQDLHFIEHEEALGQSREVTEQQGKSTKPGPVDRNEPPVR